MSTSETNTHRNSYIYIHNNVWLALDVTDSMCTVEVHILICIWYDIIVTIQWSIVLYIYLLYSLKCPQSITIKIKIYTFMLLEDVIIEYQKRYTSRPCYYNMTSQKLYCIILLFSVSSMGEMIFCANFITCNLHQQ